MSGNYATLRSNHSFVQRNNSVESVLESEQGRSHSAFHLFRHPQDHDNEIKLSKPTQQKSGIVSSASLCCNSSDGADHAQLQPDTDFEDEVADFFSLEKCIMLDSQTSGTQDSNDSLLSYDSTEETLAAQLEFFSDWMSNVDGDHVGLKLLDRNEVDFRNTLSSECPRVAIDFSTIYNSWNKYFPKPTDEFEGFENKEVVGESVDVESNTSTGEIVQFDASENDDDDKRESNSKNYKEGCGGELNEELRESAQDEANKTPNTNEIEKKSNNEVVDKRKLVNERIEDEFEERKMSGQSIGDDEANKVSEKNIEDTINNALDEMETKLEIDKIDEQVKIKDNKITKDSEEERFQNQVIGGPSAKTPANKSESAVVIDMFVSENPQDERRNKYNDRAVIDDVVGASREDSDTRKAQVDITSKDSLREKPQEEIVINKNVQEFPVEAKKVPETDKIVLDDKSSNQVSLNEQTNQVTLNEQTKALIEAASKFETEQNRTSECKKDSVLVAKLDTQEKLKPESSIINSQEEVLNNNEYAYKLLRVSLESFEKNRGTSTTMSHNNAVKQNGFSSDVLEEKRNIQNEKSQNIVESTQGSAGNLPDSPGEPLESSTNNLDATGTAEKPPSKKSIKQSIEQSETYSIEGPTVSPPINNSPQVSERNVTETSFKTAFKIWKHSDCSEPTHLIEEGFKNQTHEKRSLVSSPKHSFLTLQPVTPKEHSKLVSAMSLVNNNTSIHSRRHLERPSKHEETEIPNVNQKHGESLSYDHFFDSEPTSVRISSTRSSATFNSIGLPVLNFSGTQWEVFSNDFVHATPRLVKKRRGEVDLPAPICISTPEFVALKLRSTEHLEKLGVIFGNSALNSIKLVNKLQPILAPNTSFVFSGPGQASPRQQEVQLNEPCHETVNRRFSDPVFSKDQANCFWEAAMGLDWHRFSDLYKSPLKIKGAREILRGKIEQGQWPSWLLRKAGSVLATNVPVRRADLPNNHDSTLRFLKTLQSVKLKSIPTKKEEVVKQQEAENPLIQTIKNVSLKRTGRLEQLTSEAKYRPYTYSSGTLLGNALNKDDRKQNVKPKISSNKAFTLVSLNTYVETPLPSTTSQTITTNSLHKRVLSAEVFSDSIEPENDQKSEEQLTKQPLPRTVSLVTSLEASTPFSISIRDCARPCSSAHTPFPADASASARNSVSHLERLYMRKSTKPSARIRRLAPKNPQFGEGQDRTPEFLRVQLKKTGRLGEVVNTDNKVNVQGSDQADVLYRIEDETMPSSGRYRNLIIGQDESTINEDEIVGPSQARSIFEAKERAAAERTSVEKAPTKAKK